MHRDLVKPGVLPEQLSTEYSRLVEIRTTGEYGSGEHVQPDEALGAIEAAEKILAAIAETHPDRFTSTS